MLQINIFFNSGSKVKFIPIHGSGFEIALVIGVGWEKGQESSFWADFCCSWVIEQNKRVHIVKKKTTYIEVMELSMFHNLES